MVAVVHVPCSNALDAVPPAGMVGTAGSEADDVPYLVDGLVAQLVHLTRALEDGRISEPARRLVRRRLQLALEAAGPE